MLWLHVPGFSRPKKEKRYGDSQIITDFVFWLIIDAFTGAGKSALISFLKLCRVKNPILLLTHPHCDHGDGFLDIMNDSFFKPTAFLCYDPESLRKGLRNNEGSKEVKKDIEYLYKLINLAEKKEIPVIFLKHRDIVEYGDIRFEVYRKQPAVVANDDKNGWEYVNDGSLCCYFPELNYWTSGDGPERIYDTVKSVGAKVKAFKIPHHGNNCSNSQAQGIKKDGGVICWYNDLEPDGIGTCGFTAYGARRCKQNGLNVLESVGDINALVFGGRAYWYHAEKSAAYACSYKGKSVLKSPSAYIIRKVLRGNYGSGDTRITKVIAAGYGPKQVQTKVNRVIEIANGIKSGRLNYGKHEKRIAKIDAELGAGYGQLVQDYINVLNGVRKAV